MTITNNKFTIGKTEYTISYKEDETIDKITYTDSSNTEQNLTITNDKFTIGETEYTISAKTGIVRKIVDASKKSQKLTSDGENQKVTIGEKEYVLIPKGGNGDDKNNIICIKWTAPITDIDTVDIGILLKFGIYPKITQQISGLTSFDYVGLGDTINIVLTNKEKDIKLVSDTVNVSGVVKSYSKVLGDNTSSAIAGTFKKMGKGTFSGNYSYNQTTRVLSLKATLTGNTATINNIKYVYDSTKNTLKIGYSVVPLTDGQFVDDVTGITYKVVDGTLYVSKKIDNAGKVTINNVQYIVATDGKTVSYETLYESIFVVWEYDHDNNSETSPLIYWAQWNYKVVDKFNQVTTGDPLEAQDGNIKVKLDWVSGDYRFNPNTLELKKGDKVLGTAKWVSELNNNRYEIKISDKTYTIEISKNKMKFKDSLDEYYQSLELTEETTQNSSWADKIKLTGLDANVTSLSSAKNVSIYVDGSTKALTDLKIASDNLMGTTHSVEIKYTGVDGENGLLFNGNDIKVTFEHFDPTKSNQQSA